MLRNLRTPEQFDRSLRDVLALSTLPAVWLGAEPVRVAESLAAALFTTLQPELVFVCLEAPAAGSQVSVAQTDRYRTDAALAESLRESVFAWARTHDPDDLLLLSVPGRGILHIVVRPLGVDASLGVLAAAFRERPAGLQLTMLGLAATQAGSAVKNAQLLASLRETIEHRDRAVRQKDTLYRLAASLHRARSIDGVYDAALSAILEGLGCDRASILLFDDEGVMRFVAWRGLSHAYRAAVEGHTPWKRDEAEPQPICLADVAAADLEPGLRATVEGEGIGALAFIPLVYGGRLLGKFMTYFDRAHQFGAEELEFALAIASHIAFAVDHRRAAEALRESDRRFREMIDALPTAIYTTDAEGHVTHFNPAAATFSGRTPVLGVDRWCVSWKLYRPDGTPLPHDECPMALTLKTGEPVRGAEAIAELPDGTRRWFMPYPTPIRDAAGRPVGGINMLVDITERKAAEQRLRDADRRKDEFLAMLSHELRNPLAPIRSAVDLLQAAPHDPAAVESARAVLARQVKHMVALVDDLLDVARITRGRIQLNKERLEVGAVVASALELSRPAITAAGHALELRLAPQPLAVEGDAVRLAQIVANVLNNAARYTPSGGGRIVVRSAAEAGQAVISVRDNGIGIAPELMPQLFEMFRQGAVTNRPAHGGLGIGLWLARELARMHRGSLEARSEGPGRGSEFVLRLPLALAAPATAERPSEWLARAAAARRVLIVDDNVDAADSLGRLLGYLGHDVRVAYDARRAVAEAAHLRPDLVFVDLSMPETDGYTLASELRKGAAGIRIIAITGHGHDDVRRRTSAAGFDGHLVKPVALEALQQFLTPCLAEELSPPCQPPLANAAPAATRSRE
jgi:PAS domain S-box-containing protein